MSSGEPLKGKEKEQRAEQVVRDMDESGPNGAGPDSPEAEEPRTGRPGAGGHGPEGPGGPAPETWADDA